MARARTGRREDPSRTKGALEIVTSILLGLVSVATAVGAYQAGQWGQQSSDLASVSQQARDRNLAIFIERQIITGDDSQRLSDAVGFHAQAIFYPERADELAQEETLAISAASPALVAGYQPWVDSGYDLSLIPVATPEYEAFSQAEPQSYNIASVVADKAARALSERSYLMTIVSVVFAVALLLLGVAGVSTRLNVSAVMTGGGAVAFLVGVAIVILGVF
ncbi:MAG TPA: hypothetical protein VGO65_01495 [Pseudolysinimonas sp.]|nr:hypothetical protein [Schumannella sp.]HEV7741070.1 hypothetical protein [Pseudolysinimonas sp.]